MARIFMTALMIAGLLATAARGQEQAGTTLEQKFRRANTAYSGGGYTEALDQYRELAGMVGPSAELYYNIGCAALKSGRLGQAVVNFHRAARLDPRDSDIQANLRFVRALTTPENGGQGEENGGNVVLEKIGEWVFMLREGELALAQMVLLGLLTIGAVPLVAASSGLARRFARMLTVTTVLLLLVNSAMLGVHAYNRMYVHRAVVVEDEAEALSGPGEGNTRVLVLPEGTVVRLREEREDWALVSLPSGRSGWLKTGLIEEI